MGVVALGQVWFSASATLGVAFVFVGSLPRLRWRGLVFVGGAMVVEVRIRVGGWVAIVMRETIEVWRSKVHDWPEDARTEGLAWVASAPQ
jgi:hypothetical protein